MNRGYPTFSLAALTARIPRSVLQWSVALAVLCFLLRLLFTGSGTLVITLMLIAVSLAVLAYDKALAILVVIGYLMMVGDLRRIRDLAFSHPTLDALLLVPPAVVILLAVPLLMQLKARDRVSKAMIFLLLLMTVQIFNPSQGSISVGIAGALFSIIPVLWFWLGRQYGSPSLLSRLMYSVILPFALVAALLGLYQTFFGPLPYQAQWFTEHPEIVGIYNIGGKIRSFGFFTSPQEYSRIVSLGFAIAVTAKGRKRVWIIVAPVLLAALVLSSIRSTLLSMVFALVLAFVLRTGKSFSTGTMIRLIVVLVGCLVGLSALAARLAPSESSGGSSSTVSVALAHEAGGLADPLNQKKSTAGIHTNMVFEGLLEGFRYPIGHGLGYTSAASAKFGNGGMDTEVDIFDTFISMGLIGGALYVYIVFMLLRNAVIFSSVGPRDLRLGVIAVLVCGLGGWIQGGSYSTAAIWMFCAGAVTRPHAFPSRNRKKTANTLPSPQKGLPAVSAA